MRVARLQALITLCWLALGLAWVAWQAASPARAALGVLLVASAHAWVLGLEFMAQRWVSRGDPAPRATAAQLWRAWAHEVMAAPRVFCWNQPFRAWRFKDLLAPRHRGRRGVVLVHGYLCNRGIWNPWMAHLRQQDCPYIAVTLEPVFASIDAHVQAIDQAITRLVQVTGQPPLLVGHSMGGLAICAWLRQSRTPQRVHRLVTLGTPHGGAWLARWGQGLNARQMRPGAPWLRELQAASEPAWARHFVCFHSNADNIVFPPRHATMEGADNRLLPGLAHVQMVCTPEVMEAVLALREAPSLGAQAVLAGAGSPRS